MIISDVQGKNGRITRVLFRRSLSFLFVILLLSVSVSAAESVPADQIFPDTTQGFVAIKNLKELADQWSQTQFGRLTKDPLMDEFKKVMQKQFTEQMQNTFGMTLDAISGLPSGEVAFGMIAIPNEVPGYVLTMDVKDRKEKTAEYLENLTQKLVDIGVKQSIENYKGQKITVLKFPAKTKNEAQQAETKENKSAVEPKERLAYYMFQGDTVVASDQLHLIKLIADRIAGHSTAANPAGKSLADIADYQAVMTRLEADMPKGLSPLIRWYIEPLNYGESLRVLYHNPKSSKKDKPSIFTLLKQQGFDAIRGIGGFVNLKTESKESVFRTFIYTAKPYRLAMQMFEFPDSTNFTPPVWMPGDLARCTQVCVDPVAIFDNFGTLFDAVMMQGEKGVWKDIVKGLEEDPHGPQINLRDELIVHLGQRAMGMSRYEKPITANSESIVVAVELKAGREPDVLKAIEKLFGNDPEMVGTEHKNYKIWHRIPAEDVIEPVTIDVPSLVETVSTAPKKPVTPKEEEDTPPVFPDGAVVVAKNCLFVSTNIDYLKTILDRLDDAEKSAKSTIKDQEEYKAVDQIFASMGLTNKPHFIQLFARTHETLRPTYEMVRANRMPQSNAVLAKVMNMILEPDDDSGVRRQRIDGSALPEFDKVEKYFGPLGLYGSSEEKGYFIKGFLMERK